MYTRYYTDDDATAARARFNPVARRPEHLKLLKAPKPASPAKQTRKRKTAGKKSKD